MRCEAICRPTMMLSRLLHRSRRKRRRVKMQDHDGSEEAWFLVGMVVVVHHYAQPIDGHHLLSSS